LIAFIELLGNPYYSTIVKKRGLQMYTLVSAIGVAYGAGARWGSVNIGAIPMNTLYGQYKRVIATLTNPFITGDVGLDLNDIQLQTQGLTLTFNQYLASLGTASLPTLTTIPVIDPVYARYTDAFRAGYTVEPIAPGLSLSAQVDPLQKTDLYLKNPNIAMSKFYQSCMVTINGFYHYVDSDGNAAYVRDGDKSRQKSQFAQAGILSFNDLGTIEYLDLTSSMVYNQSTAEIGSVPLKYRTYLDIGVDIGNKIPILVLGGYMHILDDRTFRRVGATNFMIDMENIPLLNRYYESVPYLDYSSLNLPSTRMNASQVGVSDLYSDTTIKALIDLSQTFMVFLDAQDVFIDRQWVRTVPFPGKYLTGVKPEYPLVTGYGRMCEYWVRTEDTLYTQYSLSIADGIKYNYIFNTTYDPTVLSSVASNLDPNNPPVNSPAFFRLIGRDIDLSAVSS
jgi:hypothetical protein